MSTPSRITPQPPPIAPAKPIELRARGDFVQWLAASGGTLAVTTYNSGKLAFFSARDGELHASHWHFPRPMGLAFEDGSLAIASQQHVWMFRLRGEVGGSPMNYLPVQNEPCPDLMYTTGRLDAHDVAFDRGGLIFANTRFNCLARPSDKASFRRRWQPWFVAKELRQDCCHLNGVGVKAGRLSVATAFAECGSPGAWRSGDRFQSGILIDVRKNEVMAGGFCMPHSPRWHEGAWWLCDSGHGTLVRVNPQTRLKNAVAELPGFTRGLCFASGRAIVGLSRIRKRHILDAPPVRERWKSLRAGLALVDPATGAHTGSLEFIRGGREVYDVAFLTDVQGPALVLPAGEAPR